MNHTFLEYISHGRWKIYSFPKIRKSVSLKTLPQISMILLIHLSDQLLKISCLVAFSHWPEPTPGQGLGTNGFYKTV